MNKFKQIIKLEIIKNYSHTKTMTIKLMLYIYIYI